VRVQSAFSAHSAMIGVCSAERRCPLFSPYRKEATGALGDAQLRSLEERLRHLRELNERRAAILDSIGQQGKLDAALQHATIRSYGIRFRRDSRQGGDVRFACDSPLEGAVSERTS
jgi:hypothetical protein